LLFFYKLFSRIGDDIIHDLVDDIFGGLSNFPLELWHFPSKCIHPIMQENSPDDARLAYDLLQPVTMSPSMSAMDPRGARYLVTIFVRLRRFKELGKILKDLWQMIDEFFVLTVISP